MDLYAIHTALAAQINGYIADDWNVAAFPYSGTEYDLIEVWPGSDDYVAYFGTFGTNGEADGLLEVQVFIAGGDAETVFRKMTRALTVGADHGSSVVDAIHSDMTLNGTVNACRALTSRWQVNEGGLSGVGIIPVEVFVNKVSAQV